MGADDFVVGEVLDEGPELVWGCFSLAWVAMADGFRAMDQDYEVQSAGGVHEGGHQVVIGDVESLGVGVELADATGAPGGAAFYLCYGLLSPGGVDRAEGDESAAVVGCGVEDVVVYLTGHVQAGPAEPKGDGDVDIGFVHGQEEFGRGSDPGLGIAEEEGESLVLGDYLLSANHEGRRVQVGVEVDYHVGAIIVRAVGRKLDSAKGRCYNAPSTRLVMLRGVERRLARFFGYAQNDMGGALLRSE